MSSFVRPSSFGIGRDALEIATPATVTASSRERVSRGRRSQRLRARARLFQVGGRVVRFNVGFHLRLRSFAGPHSGMTHCRSRSPRCLRRYPRGLRAVQRGRTLARYGDRRSFRIAFADQQPVLVPLAIARLHADENEAAPQPATVEIELEMSRSQAFARVAQRPPRPAVPDLDVSGAVVAFGDVAAEPGVLERMILGANGRASGRRSTCSAPSAPPTRAARHRARAGNRSAAASRRVSARRRCRAAPRPSRCAARSRTRVQRAPA